MARIRFCVQSSWCGGKIATCVERFQTACALRLVWTTFCPWAMKLDDKDKEWQRNLYAGEVVSPMYVWELKIETWTGREEMGLGQNFQCEHGSWNLVPCSSHDMQSVQTCNVSSGRFNIGQSVKIFWWQCIGAPEHKLRTSSLVLALPLEKCLVSNRSSRPLGVAARVSGESEGLAHRAAPNPRARRRHRRRWRRHRQARRLRRLRPAVPSSRGSDERRRAAAAAWPRPSGAQTSSWSEAPNVFKWCQKIQISKSVIPWHKMTQWDTMS